MDQERPTANGRPEERLAQELGDRQLVAVLRGRSQAVEGAEAIRELLQRDPSRTAIVAEVVGDPESPPDVRAAGAVALGRDRRPSHQRALLSALYADQPAVVRRAAESLGKIGDEQALDELENVRPADGPAQRSVDLARTLISHRLGLERYPVDVPRRASELRVRPERAVSVKATPLRPRARAEIMADAEREVPAVPLSERGALHFSCGDNEFVVLVARDVEGERDLGSLARRSAVVGAILQKSPTTERYYLYEYLLSEPDGKEGVRLYGVRGSGILSHVGRFRPDEGGAFHVGALNTLHSPPVAIDGSYDAQTGRLTFTTALVHRDFEREQPQPATPTKLEFRVK